LPTMREKKIVHAPKRTSKGEWIGVPTVRRKKAERQNCPGEIVALENVLQQLK